MVTFLAIKSISHSKIRTGKLIMKVMPPFNALGGTGAMHFFRQLKLHSSLLKIDPFLYPSRTRYFKSAVLILLAM